ncbi:ABC transporter substrate-binding protein [Roseovarius aestuariivivens]|uniref:ABC transporter substrate-binding protein n=1 Tax=Roseovarius aestuariivivens TaxID=1888910 RepID=UPI001081EAC3|nr:ABC transporter substrate-binding protein [Roseovarius aestuariivivens]
MRLLGRLLTALLFFSLPVQADDMPTVRLAVLQIGTVNWELDTIVRNGLDEKHGFHLDVRAYADNGATRIAVAGGEADMAVADWIWVARQRAAGKDYVFIPYSKAVGGVVVPGNSLATTLVDLQDGKLGIAGGPLDKSWLLLRAYAARTYGFDLKAGTEQVYGAPPLIFKSALDDSYAGAINYWHFLAKMKAAGMKELVNVEEATAALGLDPETPLLGYYGKESFFDQRPGLAQAFYAATRDAKDILLKSDDAWENLRPEMRVETDTEFEILRRDWRSGVPKRGPIDAGNASALLTLLAELGGAELVGRATEVPEGLFAQVE